MSKTNSVRLTNYDRDTIERRMLAHRFEKDLARLKADWAVLAGAVYADLYKPSIRAKMQELPQGWLPTVNGLAVKFGGEHYTMLHFNGENYGAPSLPTGSLRKASSDPVTWRVLDKHAHGAAAAYDANHKLTKRYEEIDRRAAALKADIQYAKTQLRAALDSASTTARLKEMWPEAAPFIAHLEKPPAVQLPALPTATLNEMLKLPLKKAA